MPYSKQAQSEYFINIINNMNTFIIRIAKMIVIIIFCVTMIRINSLQVIFGLGTAGHWQGHPAVF